MALTIFPGGGDRSQLAKGSGPTSVWGVHRPLLLTSEPHSRPQPCLGPFHLQSSVGSGSPHTYGRAGGPQVGPEATGKKAGGQPGWCSPEREGGQHVTTAQR